MDYVRYLDKVKKDQMTLEEGFKYEMINKGVPDAIPAQHFLLRVTDLLPGRVHPGVRSMIRRSMLSISFRARGR